MNLNMAFMKMIHENFPKSFAKWKEEKKCVGVGCFCDFVKFFDANGIIIEISHNGYNFNYWIREEKKKNKYGYIPASFVCDFKSRPEAEIKSVYKSFEIMEGML